MVVSPELLFAHFHCVGLGWPLDKLFVYSLPFTYVVRACCAQGTPGRIPYLTGQSCSVAFGGSFWFPQPIKLTTSE